MLTYIFGEGPGGDASGNHKDTSVMSVALGACGATEVDLWATAPGSGFISLMRFNIPAIPAGETVTAATLRLYLSENNLLANSVISVINMLTNWGASDTNEGASENPATGGQATWRRSFDFNGAGGDVAWAGGGNIGPADAAGAAAGTIAIAAADPVGTQYDIDITALVAAWHTGATANRGIAVTTGAAQTVKFNSKEAVNAAVRPALLVTTDGSAASSGLWGGLWSRSKWVQRRTR